MHPSVEARALIYKAIVDAFGIIMLGLILATIVFAIVTVQSYLYFQRFTDGLYIRSMVASLWILQLASIVWMSYIVYDALVGGYGNSLVLLDLIAWKSSMWQIGATMQSAIVQSFFVHRIWKLTSSWQYTTFIAFAALAQTALGLTMAIRWFVGVHGARNFLKDYQWLMGTWLAAEIFADFAIAGTLSWHLLRKQTGARATNELIKKLVTYAISTGLISGIVSIVLIVCAFSTKNSIILQLLGMFYGGSFAVAFLTNLHSRTWIGRWERSYKFSAIDLDKVKMTTFSKIKSPEPDENYALDRNRGFKINVTRQATTVGHEHSSGSSTYPPSSTLVMEPSSTYQSSLYHNDT